MVPFYQQDKITIYQADMCLHSKPQLSERFDLILFSPPYNLSNTTGGGFPLIKGHYAMNASMDKRSGLGKWKQASAVGGLAHGYGQHDDAMPHADYVAWQNRILLTCWEWLNDGGAIYYNHKPRILEGILMPPMDYVPVELKPFVRQEIIWQRAGGINFSPAFYLPTHERIVVIARPDWRLKSKGASGVGDVWTFPQETNNPHPAPFPLRLPEIAIETTGAQTVLDCFSGSGTTLVATRDAGIIGVGIEQEKQWCEYTVERLTGARRPKVNQSELAFTA